MSDYQIKYNRSTDDLYSIMEILLVIAGIVDEVKHGIT